MHDTTSINLGLVRDIETLGRHWRAWRQGERRQTLAVELLGADTDPRQGPEIVVGREEFNIAGEIMVCLHPECGGFVQGLIRHGAFVHWQTRCDCPQCGQHYLIRDF